MSLLILTMSGCATTATSTKLPCPDRPVLEAISLEQQLQMDSFVLIIVINNQLALKEYALKLETRAGCE